MMSPIPVSVALIWLLLLGSAFAETPEPSKSSVGTIEERPTGDRTEIQSRGGFRDPIGPYGATEAEGQQASSGRRAGTRRAASRIHRAGGSTQGRAGVLVRKGCE